MAKGDNAKKIVIDKLQEAFGSDFAGVQDRKVYVWASDGAEKVQIAISLTCPKVTVGDLRPPVSEIVETAPPQVITQEESDSIEALMARLGM